MAGRDVCSDPEPMSIDEEQMPVVEGIKKGTTTAFMAQKLAPDEVNAKTALQRLPLETFLPLGSLSVVLAVGEHAINSSEKVEATNFLPDVVTSDSLRKALTALWRAEWVRVFRSTSFDVIHSEKWHLYLLPDDAARTTVDRSKANMRKHLDEVLQVIDISPEGWSSISDYEDRAFFRRWPSAEFTSLYYLFNTLPSPKPLPGSVKDRHSRWAVNSLLGHTQRVSGLRAKLYGYQRRSAAEMIRRETTPHLQLDPRLEERTTPTGNTFYYNGRDRIFLRHPRYYESVRGGILAETMGTGKTVICIAVILATKGHWPSVPPQYTAGNAPVRSEVTSLAQIVAATIARHPIPWSKYFDDIHDGEGLDMAACRKIMEQQEPYYEIPPTFVRSHRNSVFSSPPERIRLCHSTLVVVPKNLVHQWKSELEKHVEDGALEVLVLEDKNKPIPLPHELVKYDVVLFSRPRFENENRNGDEFYESPLKKLHWLRIIIDEGHSISSSGSNAAIVAEKLVRAERRWIVSGTPAKDLMGVEVDLAAMANASDPAFRQKSLEQRKAFNMFQEESSGAIKALGLLASRFLKAQPWTLSPVSFEAANDAAKWEDYIYCHESFFTKTYSGFSTCLRRTLEGLVVKTRPEDVERDVELPPLSHTIVHLEPTFYDKLTANLFVLLILSNAVTSERQDMDYLFHRNSQHHLHRLISSLRQSAFYWTGLDEASVRSSLDVTFKYLAKEDSNCSPADRQVLSETAEAAKIALAAPLWRAVTQTSEIGTFVTGWPENSCQAWAFAECREPMALGLTHAYEAQKFINERLLSERPAEGFGAAGAEAKRVLLELENAGGQTSSVRNRTASGTTAPVPEGQRSSIGADHLPASEIASFNSSPRKASVTYKGTKTSSPESVSNTKKRHLAAINAEVELSPNTELGRAAVVGTNSSKLSYLIDRVLALHTAEKVLIFYDASYIAYHIATILEIFHIKHIIYASDTSSEQRGKYLVLFNRDPTQRVMLMDIKQAAHGLNISSASRVFFCNPVCRPNIEAQAIKRAHRIGQTKHVYVETLVLKGTVEEAMHERAARMTSHEHLQAKTIEDDLGVARIIQNARILPIKEEETKGDRQMARLAVPQQIFGRPGRAKNLGNVLEKEVFGDEEDEYENGRWRGKKTKLSAKHKERHAHQRRAKTGKEAAVLIKEEPLSDHEAMGRFEAQVSSSSSMATQTAQISLFGES